MKTGWLVIGLLAAGCAAPEKTETVERSAPPAAASARKPEVVRNYTLGSYIDPDDPAVWHDAHRIQRVETPAMWANGQVRQSAAAAASEEGPAEPTSTGDGTVQTKPATMQLPRGDQPALTADDAGIVDLLPKPVTDDVPANPFAIQKPQAEKYRELRLELAGVVGGASPYALVNGQLVKAGQRFDSLEVERVEANSVLLSLGGQRIRVPVGKPVTLRLPL